MVIRTGDKQLVALPRLLLQEIEPLAFLEGPFVREAVQEPRHAVLIRQPRPRDQNRRDVPAPTATYVASNVRNRSIQPYRSF
jgi:hypothetical protein